MPARRPPGKRHDTAAGADEVAALEPPPPPRGPAGAVARGMPADAAGDDDKDDLLDQRELNQKPRRKASGPGGNRVRKDDVLIDNRRVTKTKPSDPE